MPGPAPKVTRRRRNKPAGGEWRASEGIGWQHGEIPAPPDGLKEATLEAWQTWFRSWFAAHWSPDDVPGLRLVIRMYDDVERGVALKAADKTALHSWMSSYGITPDGQQKLRWLRPQPEEDKPSQRKRQQADVLDRFSHLKVIGD